MIVDSDTTEHEMRILKLLKNAYSSKNWAWQNQTDQQAQKLTGGDECSGRETGNIT